MTPTTLQTVGRALFGPCWQREMARQLDVSSRTVNRWATGVHAIPEGVRGELTSMCLDHADELREIAYGLGESTNTDTKKDASDE